MKHLTSSLSVTVEWTDNVKLKVVKLAEISLCSANQLSSH